MGSGSQPTESGPKSRVFPRRFRPSFLTESTGRSLRATGKTTQIPSVLKNLFTEDCAVTRLRCLTAVLLTLLTFGSLVVAQDRRHRPPRQSYRRSDGFGAAHQGTGREGPLARSGASHSSAAAPECLPIRTECPYRSSIFRNFLSARSRAVTILAHGGVSFRSRSELRHRRQLGQRNPEPALVDGA